MRRRRYLQLVLLLVAVAGCGKIPLISPNRKNFPPWERLPEGKGLTYLDKFTRDPGIDPIYLAKIRYTDDRALQRVIDTFGLVRSDENDAVSSFAELLREEKPQWFPLDGITDVYEFSDEDQEYESILWVNTTERVMILERAWW